MAANFAEELVQVGGTKIQLFKGGSGEPLLLLHGSGGNRGWLRYVQSLAKQYTVYLPTHPGFGASERPDWIQNMQDLACFYTWFQEEQGLESARCIGFSMGGWLAAEMAVMCQHSFSKLMLVDPVGIKPQRGEITDIFLMAPAQIAELSFHDAKQVPEYDEIFGQTPTAGQAALAERDREMAVRLCWKPYMHDPRLSTLLARVRFPTRIVWGREDRLVPTECGHLYQEAIHGSDLVIFESCGHSPQIEKPEEFAQTALEFFSS